MSPVDTDKQEQFREWIAKAHPTTTIIEKQRDVRGRVPFASRMLTYATGGGVPFGHWIREYGPEGSGKSLSNLGMIYVGQNYPAVISEHYEFLVKHWETRNKLLALKLKREMKSLLARFPNGLDFCVFDTEQRFEEAFAERLGIDMGRVELIDENIIENIIDQMRAALEAYHVVIVDSVSNAQSYAEAALEPGSYEQGTAAQAWKRMRQVRRRFDRAENIVIFVDQVRMQLGRGPGGPRNQPQKAQPSQIRFLKHNISIDIEFEKGGKLWLDKDGIITDDYEKASNTYKALGVNAKEIAGLDIRGRVEKQSTGKPYRPYRMRFAFDVKDNRTGELVQEVSFDEAFELMEVGMDFGIIEQVGAGGGNYAVLDDDGDETGQKAKGKWRMRELIEEDDELRQRIVTRLLLAT